MPIGHKPLNFQPEWGLPLGAKQAYLIDFDPKGEAVSQEDADPEDEGVGSSFGQNRVVNQIMFHLIEPEEWKKLSFKDVLAGAEKHGIFLNEFTFEIDLFRAGAEEEFAGAVKGLTTNKKIANGFGALSH